MARSERPAPLPNALIVGAQKSGTTTLHRVLETHPEIFFPARPQEIHFFDLAANYARGLDWYRAHFAAWAGQPVVAQTSPLYLYAPEAPARIAAACPAARLLVLLRNPIDRAYSHYWHQVRYGFETLSFEAALAAEPARLATGRGAANEANRRHFSYLDRGRYTAQLARYRQHFPTERLLVLLYDELVADLPALSARAAAHLGVDPGGLGMPARGDEARHNAAMRPRWPAVQRWVRPWRWRVPALAWAVDRLNLVAARYPPMDPATRRALAAELADEADGLRELYGLDVAHWFVAAEARP